MKFDVFFPAFATLETDGSGLWTSTKRGIPVQGFDLNGVNEDEDFSELRVFFNTKDWDIDEEGLIYTDDGFENQLVEWLEQLGFDASDICYSEQGMQGYDFVSFDVGESFIKSWKAMK